MNNKLVTKANKWLYLTEDEFNADGGGDIATANDGDPTNNRDMSQEDQAKIEIYFSNLDEEIRNKILSGLKAKLNATQDDSIAEQKIIEQLSKAPLFVTMVDEIQRQLQIKI